MPIFVTIIGLSALIILHELGHYGAARLFGMRVLRFSVGFGPPLFKRRIGETEWQLAAVPLGGFVHIDGMGPKLDEEPDDERAFRHKPVWQRVAVIFAGPAMNWLLSAFFVFFLAVTVGFNQFDDASTAVGEVLDNAPAAAGGLQAHDRILAINGEAMSSWSTMVQRIEASPNEPLELSVQRGDQQLTLTVVPDDVGGVGKIGVGPTPKTVRLGFVPAIGAGFNAAATMTATQAGLLWGMLTGSEGGKLSGPAGVVKMVAAQAAKGLRSLLESLAWLSVGLFLINLAPIPALDGGRLVFLTVETIRGKPVDQRIEGIVHAVGFMLLIVILLLVTFRDLAS